MHAGEPCCGERQGVGGDKDFLGGDFLCRATSVADVQLGRGVPVDMLNAMIFVNVRAVALRGAGQASDEFAGIECAAWDFVYYSQGAGIIPGDWGLLVLCFSRALLARDFPGAI